METQKNKCDDCIFNKECCNEYCMWDTHKYIRTEIKTECVKNGK